MKGDMVDFYRDLMADYQKGLVTEVEATSRALDLLYESSARQVLWNHLDVWVKSGISEVLRDFDASQAPFALKPARAEDVKIRLTELKRWHSDNLLGT